MTKPTPRSLRNIGKDESSREFLYHVNELIESESRLADLVNELDGAVGEGSEAVVESLGRIEVELFHHLAYHLAEMRAPFVALLKTWVGPDAEILVDRASEDGRGG